jgi:hypothetical protein
MQSPPTIWLYLIEKQKVVFVLMIDEILVLEGSESFVDVSCLSGHRENHLLIAVFPQTAFFGKGKSI